MSNFQLGAYEDARNAERKKKQEMQEKEKSRGFGFMEKQPQLIEFFHVHL